MSGKFGALARVGCLSLAGSIAMWCGFAYVNNSWRGDARLAAMAVFAVCSALCMAPISYLAYRDSREGMDGFVRKMRDDGGAFFRVFALAGALCMGASIAIDALGGGIWLFELGLWVEALDAWAKGYISMVGFWYAPRGHRGL